MSPKQQVLKFVLSPHPTLIWHPGQPPAWACVPGPPVPQVPSSLVLFMLVFYPGKLPTRTRTMLKLLLNLQDPMQASLSLGSHSNAGPSINVMSSSYQDYFLVALHPS